MISTKDKIEFKGTVTATGTGDFTAEITEFLVADEWFKLSTPITQTIKTSEYSEDFTTDELTYIQKQANTDAESTTLDIDTLAVVKSIAKKVPTLMEKASTSTATTAGTTTSDSSDSTSG